MLTKWIDPGENFDDAKSVREAVFVVEQGYPVEEEYDEHDKNSHQVVFYDKTIPVATGRVFEDKDNKSRYILGRIAVLKAYRGKNIGRDVVIALCEKAEKLGATSLYLGSQSYAKEFYEKIGFAVCGDEYMDGHVPHLPMDKNI